MRGWAVEAWDRVVASDPGLSRLRMAAGATVAMASALAIEYTLAALRGAGQPDTVIAMLLGAIVSMMGSMALTGNAVWPKIRTAVFFPVAFGVGLAVGVTVAGHTDLMLTMLVVMMFAAVVVRRFGIPFFFYGFMGWMGYFFASFLHATPAMLPALLLAIVAATAWVLLLSTTVLRTNPTRALRRVVRAFDARARAVARACADLLEAADGKPRRRARVRLRARQAGLAEAALMVEGWSAEPGALPPGNSAAVLRRRLIDAQHLLDRMAASAEALATAGAAVPGALAMAAPAAARDAGFPAAPAAMAEVAAQAADRLARREDHAAVLTAHALAGSAGAGTGAESRSAWHFAVAVLELVALAGGVHATDPGRPRAPAARPGVGGSPPDADATVDEFEPVVGLAMGNLPGSPAVARDVPARGRRWNPVARLGMVNRQALQVAVAGGLAVLVGRELSPARYYWAVIAAFIMFTGTATRTETFLKGLNRVLGTLLGLVASIELARLTAGGTTAVLVVIVLSMFCGFYLIRLSYAYMIFFITIMLGQLYSALHQFSPGLLVLRLEETVIGAAIGFAVALVVAPLSTQDTVRSARNTLLTSLADLLTAAADRIAPATGAPPAPGRAPHESALSGPVPVAVSAGPARGTGTPGGSGPPADGVSPPGVGHQPSPGQPSPVDGPDPDADPGPPDLDALSRTMDKCLWQLALVAKPLTRPLLAGSTSPRTRHRLVLYAALTTHARTLAVALRAPIARPPAEATPAGAAAACRALAEAATQLTAVRPGHAQPAVAGPLADADAALFAHASALGRARANDRVLRSLIHLQQLLGQLADPAHAGPPPYPPLKAGDPLPAVSGNRGSPR